jgi:hypothetical protein
MGLLLVKLPLLWPLTPLLAVKAQSNMFLIDFPFVCFSKRTTVALILVEHSMNRLRR